MKQFFALAFILASTLIGKAQVIISTPDTSLCPNSTITLNANIGSNAGNGITVTDDVYTGVIPLGFTFNFYGNNYTDCVISSNGFVSFNTFNANLGSNWQITSGIPGNTDCLNSVMGPFFDIDPSASATSTIEYSTQGIAPNRRFVVTYCDVPLFSCTSLLAKFQIVLFETSNNIEIHINDKPICTSWNVGAAIEGVQNATGTQAVVVPGRNYPTQWTATNSSHLFTPSATSYTVSPIAFQFYPTGLNNITWFENGTTVAGAGNSITVSPTVNTFYVATANGCIGSSSDTVNITIANSTPAPGVMSPVGYCQNDLAAPLSANGINLQWYTTPFSGTPTLTPPTPNTATPGTTTFYVSQKIGNCEGPRDSIVVQINSKPTASIAANALATCVNDTLVFIDSTTNPSIAVYTWDFDGGNVISGNNEGPYEVIWNTGGTKTITHTAAENTCIDSKTLNVTINVPPTSHFSLPSNACIKEIINVQADFVTADPNGYDWDFGTANVSAGTGADNYQLYFTFSGDKIVSLVTTSAEGCVSVPFVDTITVQPTPEAKIEVLTTARVCIGDVVQFGTKYLGPNFTYSWMPDAFFQNSHQSTVEAKVSKNDTIYLTVKDKFGCANYDSLAISAEPCCTIAFPTGFTPNGDGQNDKFRPATGDAFKIISFLIVNRWGQTVYESLSLTEGWDGNFKGVAQPVGDYQFFIRYQCPNGAVNEKKGDVLLIR